MTKIRYLDLPDHIWEWLEARQKEKGFKTLDDCINDVIKIALKAEGYDL